VSFSLKELETIVAERAKADGQNSYTRQLLDKGTRKCAQKLGEEAVEAAIAASVGDSAELTKEAADVLYHLLVLLRSEAVPLEAVMDELKARTVRSGLEEKAARHVR